MDLLSREHAGREARRSTCSARPSRARRSACDRCAPSRSELMSSILVSRDCLRGQRFTCTCPRSVMQRRHEDLPQCGGPRPGYRVAMEPESPQSSDSRTLQATIRAARSDAAELIEDDTYVSPTVLNERASRFATGQARKRGLAWRVFASRLRRDAAMEADASVWLEQSEWLMTRNRAQLRPSLAPVGETSARYREIVHHSLDRDPRPRSTARGSTPREAELLVRDWMRHMGVRDAEATKYTGDGGVDVVSRRFIAQVKHYTTPVGVAAIRELKGVATVDGREALFFALSGYTPAAIAFAERAEVALFVYSDRKGTLTPMNTAARRVGP